MRNRRLTLDYIEDLGNGFTSEELKADIKQMCVLQELNSIWSDIYVPLIKCCETYQKCSIILESLKHLSHSTDYSSAKINKMHCHKLIASLIKECLLILYPYAKTTILGIFNSENFTLLRSFFQNHCYSNLEKSLKTCSIPATQLFSQYYEPLYVLKIIFFSQYHFVRDLLDKVKKGIQDIESCEYKNSEQKLRPSSFLKIPQEEPERPVSLFWKTKQGIVQTSTTNQQAYDYIYENCLVILP